MDPSIGPTTIRPMRADDAAAVAALTGELGYPASPDDLSRRIHLASARPESQLLVAEEGGRVIGWLHVYGAYLLESDPHAEIGGLVITEDARGRGVGAALVSAAEAWARERDFAAIRVRSNILRHDAHAFYERLGYRLMKTQKNFRKELAAGPASGSGRRA
jgi:ribosomal protein S18 acetylase RimI-like enzyme